MFPTDEARHRQCIHTLGSFSNKPQVSGLGLIPYYNKTYAYLYPDHPAASPARERKSHFLEQLKNHLAIEVVYN
jgi:hypothetical protein